MFSLLIGLALVYGATSSALPPSRDENHPRLVHQPDPNSGVYHQELRLPLKTFVGENKVEYGCAAFPLKGDEYIMEYLPQGEVNDVYHMTISVCDAPYEDSPVWECMDPKHVCKGAKREVMFAWTNGAPGWTLPEIAGVYTGNQSKYIIFQVHGRDDISSERAQDYASMRLTIQTERPQLDAAIGIYAVGGFVPPLVDNFTADVACLYNLSVPAPILSYGLHTHTRGIAQSGYIVRDGEWIEIGRGDPLYPLVLFDVTERNLWLQPGDIIASRCTYRNHGTERIPMGYTHLKEMCNLFLHYGVPHDMLEATMSNSCYGNAQNSQWESMFDTFPADASNPDGDTDQARFIKEYGLTKNY